MATDQVLLGEAAPSRHPPRRITLPTSVLAVLVVAVLVAASAGICVRDIAANNQRAVLERRVSTLKRGVNLSQWFSQAPPTPDRLQTAIQLDDVQRIRRMGFDHVRLPVDPEVLAPSGDLTAPDGDTLYYLDDAIRLLLDNGLAVIVDLHPEDSFKQRLVTDPALVEQTAQFWTILARRLSPYDPDRLFLEALNEPGFPDAATWAVAQRRLVDGIRAGAPAHTIIATGHAWSGVEQLEAIEPLPDPNVAYTFHFYEPHLFTHQGATWTHDLATAVRGVPYPSSPIAVAPLLATTTDAAVRAALIQYGDQRWDADAVDAQIARADTWAHRNQARVLCGEFGAYRLLAPAPSRLAWLADVRRSLDAHQIGWTVWDYAGGFGVVIGKPEGRVIDAPTARALLEP